jgi:hypothetical protein
MLGKLRKKDENASVQNTVDTQRASDHDEPLAVGNT